MAPGDVEQPDVAGWIPAGRPSPASPLPFPSLLVGSRNDPYCRFERAQDWPAIGCALHRSGRARPYQCRIESR